MPARSKPARTKRTTKRATRPRRGALSVRDAADVLGMTPQGVYAAIRRGDIPATRTDGRITVTRAAVREFDKTLIEWKKKTDPNRRLTEEEFLQALWDSDPD